MNDYIVTLISFILYYILTLLFVVYTCFTGFNDDEIQLDEEWGIDEEFEDQPQQIIIPNDQIFII